MGILTTKESARSFSSYVTAFGLALLIASIVYLKRLDNSTEKFACVPEALIGTTAVLPDFPSCSIFSSWRVAAIIGIIIGVIDTLIMPFLYCCLCFTACGCALCVSIGCSDAFTDESPLRTRTRNFASNGEMEHTETSTINVEPDDRPKTSTSYDVEKVPSKLHMWLNSLGWILWVLGPFVATLYITISLYKYDAIRTRSDELYNSALVLFIVALLNLMVYLQKFMDSVCGYGHKKVTKTSK